MAIDFENKTDTLYDLKLIQKIALDFTKKDIELIVCDNQSIQEINKTYRKIDKATDVLSFPYDNIPILGSIIINNDFVQKMAKELKHTAQDEFILLFIHGLLHILGYDHEIDIGQMREKEEELIKKYKLPLSLITRNQE
jgi:probable rRNA maturation factor